MFELLYARHAPTVKAYALRRSNASLADDVVAEVFVVCWRRLEEIPAEALPWLLAVARRVLSTQRRSELRRAALADRVAAHSPISATADTEIGPGTSASENGALSGALARLSESDRELLLLIAWEGLTPSQAALVLEVKPATVRVRLLRARRRLSHALERAVDDAPMCSTVSMEVSR
ncbi:MAG: RNA polymerase sigma factor [Solirubrobacteraceae bacterium]